MRESIVMPETVASVLCKFMERNYSRSGAGGSYEHQFCDPKWDGFRLFRGVEDKNAFPIS